MYTHREDARKLGNALVEHDAKHQTISFVDDHTKQTPVTSETAEKRRRLSMIKRSVKLVWLSSKVNQFGSSWWAGSFVIAMRIMQTSAMVFLHNPGLQAAVASLIALAGVAVQTHAAPYRQASDNHVALAAAWLLFLWPFVLLVRYLEAVGGQEGVALGVLLIAATVIVVAFAAYALVLDMKKYAMNDDRGDSSQAEATQTTMVTEEDQGSPSKVLANTPATEAPLSPDTGVIAGIDIVDVDATMAHDSDEEDNNAACLGGVACSL